MKTIKLFICCLLFARIAFAQEAINLNQGEIAPAKYLQTIPYEKIKGKILVTVSINGKNYRFLFDTGAPFAISRKLHEALGLSDKGSIPVQDASNKQGAMMTVTVPRLQLGDLAFLNTPGIVFQDSAAQVLNCFGIDGIIGSNMLRHSVVQFDDANQQIILTDNAKNLSLKGVPYQELKLSASQSNPFIKLILKKGNKTATDNLLFDSGADDFYEMSTYAYKFLQEKTDVIDVLAQSKGSFGWGFHGINEQQDQYLLNIPSASLCGFVLKDVIATTTSSNESRIGAKTLKYGKTTLDYEKKRFYFEPYNNAVTSDLSKRPWAIAPTLENNKLVVGIIWDKSLESKINPGDELLEFAGDDYRSKDLCELVRLERDLDTERVMVKLKDVKTGEIKTVAIGRL